MHKEIFASNLFWLSTDAEPQRNLVSVRSVCSENSKQAIASIWHTMHNHCLHQCVLICTTWMFNLGCFKDAEFQIYITNGSKSVLLGNNIQWQCVSCQQTEKNWVGGDACREAKALLAIYFYHVSLTFSRKTYCVAQIFWSQPIGSLFKRCLLCFHWVLVAPEENLHKRFFASHPVLYQALYDV